MALTVDGVVLQLVDLPLGYPGLDLALPVLRELRTDLTSAVLEQVLTQGAPQGLRFLAAFDDDRCLGVAGWRLVVTTSVLRKLYVDDLVATSGARSQGVGAALLRELEQRARDAGCRTLELDSGVQRYAAHRFYLRKRMDINAHHFAKTL